MAQKFKYPHKIDVSNLPSVPRSSSKEVFFMMKDGHTLTCRLVDKERK